MDYVRCGIPQLSFRVNKTIRKFFMTQGLSIEWEFCFYNMTEKRPRHSKSKNPLKLYADVTVFVVFFFAKEFVGRESIGTAFESVGKLMVRMK